MVRLSSLMILITASSAGAEFSTALFSRWTEILSDLFWLIKGLPFCLIVSSLLLFYTSKMPGVQSFFEYPAGSAVNGLLFTKKRRTCEKRRRIRYVPDEHDCCIKFAAYPGILSIDSFKQIGSSPAGQADHIICFQFVNRHIPMQISMKNVFLS